MSTDQDAKAAARAAAEAARAERQRQAAIEHIMRLRRERKADGKK